MRYFCLLLKIVNNRIWQKPLYISYAIICYMETEQMNIRLSKDLTDDLEIVSGILKINRSEWVKSKLAEEIHREKNRLLMELSTLYSKGMIAIKSVEELVGKDIANEMEFIKETSIESSKMGAEYGKKIRGKLKK